VNFSLACEIGDYNISEESNDDTDAVDTEDEEVERIIKEASQPSRYFFVQFK
jgi:hypothetical protein